MRRIVPLLLVPLLLAALACGSRADTDATDEGLDGGPDPTDGPTAAEPIGTLDNPCGGEASGGAVPDGVPGVSDDTIRIGVISDKENDIAPVPTICVEDAVRAFVEMCNDLGGINGRRLDLVTYDSQILRTDDVTKEACANDLFALVGSGSVQDQLGVETREGCGLIEVAAYSATTSRSLSQDFFSPLPGLNPTEYNVGTCRFIAERFPDAVTKAAMVWTELPAPEVRGHQIVEACEAEAGFDFVVQEGLAFGNTNYGPLVSQMKSAGVRYFSMVSASSETLALLREIREQGLELEVIDLGQQYYEEAVAADGAAEGAWVLTNTVPFDETDEYPAMAFYRDAVEQVGGVEGTLGVQAFSAAMLFATAVQEMGDDLTREALVEQLSGIHEWDGGGLHMTADPGANTLPECFMFLRIVDGEFVREHPSEGFDCDPAHIRTSTERFES